MSKEKNLDYYLERNCDKKDIDEIHKLGLKLYEYVDGMYEHEIMFSINRDVKITDDKKDLEIILVMNLCTGLNFSTTIIKEFNQKITLRKNIDLLFEKYQDVFLEECKSNIK